MGFLGARGEYATFLKLTHLRIFVASLPYLLAMKCMAMRLGEEFHDVNDVRFLLRALNITAMNEAVAIVARYFDESGLPPKTRFALEEILG